MNKQYTEEQEGEYKVMNDVLMYLWNVDFYTFIESLFECRWGLLHDVDQQYYIDKYMKVKAHNAAGIWSLLDKEKQMRLIKISLDYYGRVRQ
tara:strand:- start:625 stop:900 length:276 start_codon:yes stop_codon:yes gene_type:complete